MGEQIVTTLGGMSHTTFLPDFVCTDISALASQSAVDGSVALATWFKTMFHMSVNARDLVATFKQQRLDLIHNLLDPSAKTAADLLQKAAPTMVDPVRTLLGLFKESLKRFATDPMNSDVEVHTRLLELVILALTGSVVISGGRWRAVSYLADSEPFLRAGDRLGQWCASLRPSA